MNKNLNSKFDLLKKTLLEMSVSESEIEALSPIKNLITDVITENKFPSYAGMVFVELERLTDTQKCRLIDIYHEAYFCTNIDKKNFGPEFVTVTGGILSNRIPVKLEFLLVEDIYDSIIEELT